MRCDGRGLFVGSVLAIAALGAACSSGGSDRVTAGEAPSSTGSAAPEATKGPIRRSPSLHLAITPDRGAPGTTVRIVVTGCDDPTGQNHAVSFNNDADDMAARNDPNTVRAIVAEQDGTTLTATYTIRPADLTGGAGMFFAQCAATTRTAPFTVHRS